MKMLRTTAIVATLLASLSSRAQQYLDYQLRLEPVWSRVADALGEFGSVESAEFSPDGKYIVSGTKYDNSVVMWRTSDGYEVWRQQTRQEVERVGWSSDGKWVAAASEDFVVTIYDATNGKEVRKLKHSQGIDGLVWSNKGSLLVTGEESAGSSAGNVGGKIKVFDMKAGKEIASLDFGSTVNRVYFSNDDQFLLGIGHGAVKIFKVADWTLVQSLRTDEFVNFASGVFSPDGRYVIGVGATKDVKGHIFLWDWQKGELLKRFNHTGRKIETVAWHPRGGYIVHAGHDPYIFVYRVSDILAFGNDAIPVAHKVWAGDHAEFVDFNADGSFLVSAHQNGLIRLWVWMGEESDLNSKQHRGILKAQEQDRSSQSE